MNIKYSQSVEVQVLRLRNILVLIVFFFYDEYCGHISKVFRCYLLTNDLFLFVEGMKKNSFIALDVELNFFYFFDLRGNFTSCFFIKSLMDINFSLGYS